MRANVLSRGSDCRWPSPAAAPAPVEPSASIDYNQLEQIGKLRADGTLTDEEFAAAKAKILGG